MSIEVKSKERGSGGDGQEPTVAVGGENPSSFQKCRQLWEMDVGSRSVTLKLDVERCRSVWTFFVD